MRKFKRLLSAIPVAFVVAFVALCFSAFTLLKNQPAVGSVPNLTFGVVVGVVAALLLLVVQTFLEYRRRTYDPTWVLKFQDTWESREEIRATASKVIRDNRDKLSRIKEHESLLCPIDDVLDMLEDVGFYVHGDQISPEVAHHHFYHWIRGYWCAAQNYIKAWQIEETARWQHLPKLYDETSEVELTIQGGKKPQLWRNAEQIAEFLREEIGEEE
jgi:hypothetical protein